MEQCLDGGDMSQIRASTSSADERGGLRGFAVCSNVSLFGGGVAQQVDVWNCAWTKVERGAVQNQS